MANGEIKICNVQYYWIQIQKDNSKVPVNGLIEINAFTLVKSAHVRQSVTDFFFGSEWNIIL